MIFLYIIAGLISGAILTYIFLKKETSKLISEHAAALKNVALENIQKINALNIEYAVANEKINNLIKELEKSSQLLEQEKNAHQLCQKRSNTLEAENKNLTEKINIQKEEFEALHQKLNKEFELIASKILRENSKDISEIHNKNITDILSPLKEKISSFEKKVEEAYDKELRDKIDLKAELKSLHELNKRISDEANNLTKALKGDNKKQGNWGEIVLERVLERSGLNKGQEYELQYSVQNDENKRIQPDVVVFLPEKKHIIIDAKVSLIAYERFINADNEDDKQKFIKEHISSVKNHISLLSEKKYHDAEGLISPEFVLLFMPIESSFSAALQNDSELFSFAWDKKIVIVSPTTLLATLRTIASIWKQENQTKNAIEIARQGGALYDKLVSFVNDLIKIGNNIESLSATHSEAMKKLQTGTGNLIGRAENIKKLGAKTSKIFNDKFIDSTQDSTQENIEVEA